MITSGRLIRKLVVALEDIHNKYGPGDTNIIKLIEDAKEHLFWTDDYERKLR